MAKLNFYLDKPNSKEETRIILSYHIYGKRIKISIGEKIHPDNWNSKKQEVKEKIATEEFRDDLNTILKNIKEDLEKARLDAKSKRKELTKNDILKVIVWSSPS